MSESPVFWLMLAFFGLAGICVLLPQLVRINRIVYTTASLLAGIWCLTSLYVANVTLLLLLYLVETFVAIVVILVLTGPQT